MHSLPLKRAASQSAQKDRDSTETQGHNKSSVVETPMSQELRKANTHSTCSTGKLGAVKMPGFQIRNKISETKFPEVAPLYQAEPCEISYICLEPHKGKFKLARIPKFKELSVAQPLGGHAPAMAPDLTLPMSAGGLNQQVLCKWKGSPKHPVSALHG